MILKKFFIEVQLIYYVVLYKNVTRKLVYISTLKSSHNLEVEGYVLFGENF